MSGNVRSLPARPYLRTIAGLDQRTAASGPPIAILLSVYQGETHLNQQLDSFLAQTDTYWRLYWRDDGSSDATRAIMLAFQENRGQGRCEEVTTEPGNIGVARSYAALLDAVPEGALVAYADQDDVWLDEKLAWGRAALADAQGPTLYCARQYLTDDRLSVTGSSLALKRAPDFRNALIQNLATGHTVLLNTDAVRLAKTVLPPDGILHDWWAYLLVLGAGGTVVFDPRCVSFYRQHSRNAVGVERSAFRRGLRALRRGPDAFMALLAIITKTLANPPVQMLLTPDSLGFLERLQQALDGSIRTRVRFLLTERGFTRQRYAETMVFRLWFLLYGKPRPQD